jgi:hypothetical protein
MGKIREINNRFGVAKHRYYRLFLILLSLNTISSDFTWS